MWLIINGELVLYGFVGEAEWDVQHFTALDVLEALPLMGGDIRVRLNSGGGYSHEGLAIYNALRLHAQRTGVKVIITVDAVALSSASLIACAGDTVIMNAGSVMMIHDPSNVAFGTADQQRQNAEALDTMADQYAAIYAAKAGISVEDARAVMKAETWYSAEQAVEAGFADEVSAPAAMRAAPSLFDYRLYQNSPVPLTTLATASASMFQPKAARAAQPQENSMTLEQLIATLTARFGKPADDVKMFLNQAIMAGIALVALVPLVKDAATMEAAQTAVKGKLTEMLGVPVPQTTAAPAPVPAPPTMSVADIRDLQNRAATAGVSLADLNTMMAVPNATKDTVSAAIIDKVAQMNGDGKAPAATAQVTEDARDKFREGAARSLMMKVGLEKGERNEFSGLSLVELARMSLITAGVNGVTKMDRMLMVGTAFTAVSPIMSGGGMHSTSDFAYILQNVASKSALKGFQEAEETFQLWTSKGQASDFKAMKRVDLGLFPALDKVAEGAEFKYAKLSDRGVSIAIDTYGKLVAITRQAIINDDLSMLDKVPMKMGRAAKRTIGNLVYGLLNANAALADSVALFHATHANLAGSGAAPSEATFQAGYTAMQKQKDADAHATALNISPKFFLSSAYQFTAKQLLESSGSLTDAKSAGVVNTVQGLVTPITDQRISGNAWYFAADPSQYDTIEVTYLDGVEEPTLESKEGWTIDGTELKVRLDAAATVLDFRGLYKNAGP